MAANNTDAEAKLRKLGARIRAGNAAKHPPQKGLQIFRESVKEFHEREVASKSILPHSKTSYEFKPKRRDAAQGTGKQPPPPKKGREPNEPEP